MSRRIIVLGALLAVACGPKQVQSPLEKAPPPAIAEARELAGAGDSRSAMRAYEAFIAGHPGTVEADLARLELGLLHADDGRCEDALLHFEQASDSVDRAIALRAALHLGSCQLVLGDPERSLDTLLPVAGERFAPEEQALLWDTALVAGERTTNAALGLRVLDGLARGGSEPPEAERTWQTTLLLANKVTLEEASALADELTPDRGPHAAVSMRLLEQALVSQDGEQVRFHADALRSSDWIAIAEVAVAVARADEFLHGNPYAVGALLPLSGRGREVGRQLLQGMQLAQLDEGGPELVVRDTAGDPGRTSAAVEELVGEAGVIAILGPVSTRTTQEAAEGARRAGVPLLSFAASEEVTAAGDEIFRLLHGPRDEITALVATARAAGLSRFIILYPDHGYGRAMERLFDQEVAAAGGVACEGVAYPPGTKSLVEYVRIVLETSCDAILLADTANQVAVAAPTFAAEGAWSLLGGPLPEHVERRIHFLLPSVSWSSALVARTGRYLQGAWITLPYDASSQEPLAQRFETAYATRYGRPPETFAAYGYDAYRLLSAALRQGHQTREALVEALIDGPRVSSLTPLSGLSAERVPAEAPRVYRIRGEALERSK